MREMVFIIFLAMILTIAFYLALKKEEDEVISYVFINQKTKKYHQHNCSYSKGLNSMPLKIAIKKGYTPCKICNETKE